jgi:hypothetical protein
MLAFQNRLLDVQPEITQEDVLVQHISVQLYHLALQVEEAFNALVVAQTEQRQKEIFAKQIVDTI